MSGRIRSIKPELIEDAITAGLSDMAFRLFIACILLADDHGGLRFEPSWIKGQVYWALDVELEAFSNALGELDVLIEAFIVKGQRYGAIRNWKKHQKVDHPSKPRVPRPPSETSVGEALATPSRDSRENLAPDLRSPIPISDPERDLTRAPASVAVAPEPETSDQPHMATLGDGPPSLDEPVPEMWLVQAQSIVRSRCLDVDPKDSWRCYVLRLNEPGHNAPASLARYLRWVHDDCSRQASKVGVQHRREWAGPSTRDAPIAPYHVPSQLAIADYEPPSPPTRVVPLPRPVHDEAAKQTAAKLAAGVFR